MRYALSCTALCLVALCLSIPQEACGAHPTFDTPKAQVIYTVDEVVLRVNELEKAAISANDTGGLSEANTRIFVQWAVATDQVLAHAPEGWRATVAAGWAAAKQKAGPQANPALTAAMGLVDVVLAITPGGTR